MPTKSKLSRNKVPPQRSLKPVKKEEITASTSQSSTEPRTTLSGLNPEAEDQFELELCWCIQHLQTGLLDTKLQEKQIYNLTKSLNVLKSNNASLIKKRQVMRNTFGDYRSKMIEDEKKFGRTSSSVKFIPCDLKKCEKKSSFLRKAHFLTDKTNKDQKLENDAKEVQEKVTNNPQTSNDSFKFNFSLSTS